MAITVKICGFTEPSTVRVAAEAGVDWIGFNFAEKSPRRVRPSDMGRLLPEIGNADAIGLLVDPEDAQLEAVLATGLQHIQLHGSETPERVADIARHVSGEVWKAVGVETRQDLDQADAYAAADRLLIDARPPKGDAQKGGHGIPFDWSIIENWQSPKPWVLAGGLAPGNVVEAVSRTQATLVDVSSGVERERGVKDAGLIREFIVTAKGI
ncbi:MAG: phosphoribosylanthranilate isomerase [Pseudomonadota bacterium]